MKLRRKMIGILMAGTLVVGMGTTAMAQDVQNGSEETPATAAITKELQFAEGVDNPGGTFTFDFTAEKFEESTTLPAGTPELDTTITIAADAAGTTAEGLTTVMATSGNIFEGKTFPAAGVYEYSVVELGIYNSGEYGMDYSDAKYDVNVYVKNGENGTYVYSVTVNAVKDDEGNDLDTPQKVDPEVPAGGEGNGFKFVNVYTELSKGDEDPDDNTDPDDPFDSNDAALTISKTVAGEYGDRTKEFSFAITITKAATSDETEFTGMIGGTPYTFESGVTKTITLKHGQSLVFETLPTGTKYSVAEQGVSKYTPSARVVVKDGIVDKNAQKGEPLTISDQTVYSKVNNGAAVTNTYDDASVTPTGIIINNLPFILLIVVAAAGLSLYVVSRRRFRR